MWYEVVSVNAGFYAVQNAIPWGPMQSTLNLGGGGGGGGGGSVGGADTEIYGGGHRGTKPHPLKKNL